MARVALTVRIADAERFRLLLWELRVLADDMRVGASPFAERLERSLDRFTDGDERADMTIEQGEYDDPPEPLPEETPTSDPDGVEVAEPDADDEAEAPDADGE